MSIQEIEKEIENLPPSELAQLAAWFVEYHAEAWDRQIESDLKEGRLSALISEARAESAAGRTKPL